MHVWCTEPIACAPVVVSSDQELEGDDEATAAAVVQSPLTVESPLKVMCSEGYR